MEIRSRRDTDTYLRHKGNTPANVGPGSYKGVTEFAQSTPAYAGFASSKPRVLNPNKSTSNMTPGPGAFMKLAEPASAAPDAKAQNTFATKVARFAPFEPGSSYFLPSTIKEVPGPGTYSMRDPILHRKTKPLVKSDPLYIGNHRTPVPAIPRPEQSYGYEENDTGKLVLQQRPQTDAFYSGLGQDTIGPTYYNPALKLVRGKTKNIDFHKSHDQRTLWEPNQRLGNVYPDREVPGPGHYEFPDGAAEASREESKTHGVVVGRTNQPKLRGVGRLKESSAFASLVPTAQSHIPYKSKQSVPGPGAFTETDPVDISRSRDGGAQNFGSTAVREGWNRNPVQPFVAATNEFNPGPGTYSGSADASSFKKVSRKKLTDDVVGFDSTGDRFGMAANSRKAPGPGEYDHGDQNTIETRMHARKEVGIAGRFGSTEERFRGGVFPSQQFVDRKRFPIPGPGAHEGGAPVGAASGNSAVATMAAGRMLLPLGTTVVGGGDVLWTRPAKQSSVFESVSSRFQSARGSATVDPRFHTVGQVLRPAPNQYSVPSQFSAREKRTKAQPFSSTQSRFRGGKPAQIFFGMATATNTPGPGAYNSNANRRNPGRTHRTRQRYRCFGTSQSRWNKGSSSFLGTKGTSSHVGPGSYNRATDVSMMKQSFNVTLGGSNPRGRARMAPRGPIRQSKSAPKLELRAPRSLGGWKD